MKVTLGQFEPILGDKLANLRTMENIMKQAAKEEADLVLFPELCLTGYFIQDLDEDVAEPIDGESVQYMKSLCKRYDMHTVFSWAELGENGKVYNSACLINDLGQVAGNYRKIHLYDREKEIFVPGDSYHVFDTKLGRIGIMICYELDFPEVARILNLKQADVILIPTNNFYPYEKYQETYLKSRSMENEIPVVICNRTGQEQDLKYFGESAAYDAHGNLLVKLDEKDRTETVKIPLHIKRDGKLNYINNRLANTYKALIQQEEK